MTTESKKLTPVPIADDGFAFGVFRTTYRNVKEGIEMTNNEFNLSCGHHPTKTPVRKCNKDIEIVRNA